MIKVTNKLRERFYRNIRVENGCWIWLRSLKEDGYPSSIRVDKSYCRVSHVALAIDGRPKPNADALALHSCDNPSCVNPSHLRWGTEVENLQDAISRWKRKGRSFSPAEVKAIRASTESHTEVARRYGVTVPCILNIRKKVTHKHVN